MAARDADKTACPLQCGRRHGAVSRDRVDWAGLPTNLDMAFSQAQCDKVYAQHLLRRRHAQLRRWLPRGEHVCVCEVTAEVVEDLDAAKDYVTS
ncbi:hypothetical protein [Mycobacterium sp. SP-6446]|uniref:hypothetical protein n=1 Tax=Mycobacterium sp. SP-6446 TaxID=1834162 RepID=UPI00096CA717|nr:hypothetical protein [Mycobacterium sp. SP-6446]OMC22149.1 hypothetical protein A5736_10610 [Mycobacterium sp. SP-6446]